MPAAHSSMLGDCRVTPQKAPGDQLHKTSQSDAGRGRPSKHNQTDHKPPNASETADVSVEERKPDQHRRRRSQDSRQESEERQQSEAGSGNQDGQPLVQYQDEEQPQYSNGYDGTEPEGQDYDMEGSAQQEQQYGDEEDGGQQQYGSGDEEQAEGYAEEQAQYEEDAQIVDAPTGQQKHSSGQENVPDEWDVPAEGIPLQHHDCYSCLHLCKQERLQQHLQLSHVSCHSLCSSPKSHVAPGNSLTSRMVLLVFLATLCLHSFTLLLRHAGRA